jgi:hypothetical protein
MATKKADTVWGALLATEAMRGPPVGRRRAVSGSIDGRGGAIRTRDLLNPIQSQPTLTVQIRACRVSMESTRYRRLCPR